MLGKVFSCMTVISFICAAATGNMQRMSMALASGVGEGVTLCLALMGTMCFWNGIMKVFDAVGATKVFSKLLKPLLRLIYSEKVLENDACGCICASMAANFFGLGNAALPLGIKAMKSIEKSENSTRAGKDMIMFAVLNTVPFQFVPTTLIALRTAHGSKAPFDIILPVWICSAITICFAVFLCKMLSKIADITEAKKWFLKK